MYTFNKMWGVITPQEAADKIEQQKKEAGITEPKIRRTSNQPGRDRYLRETDQRIHRKQWGRPCTELPSLS